MVVYLKFLKPTIEKKFKDWSKEFFNNTRGSENKGFTTLIEFFESDIGKEAFKKWLIEQNEKIRKF